MATLTLPAQLDQLAPCTQFVVAQAQAHGLSLKRIHDIELALEEAFVNVSQYAYPDGAGDVTVTCTVDDRQRFIIDILDYGQPFNPLSLATPDVTSDVTERPVGGLGIFLIRKLMDDVTYERQDNQNRLRLVVQQSQLP